MTNTPTPYDVAVIGAGPAGCMAAIRAAQCGHSVVLLERNDTLGQKLLLTGNGRCNLTNTALRDSFLKKFYPHANFYRPAFFAFFRKELEIFFRNKGLSFIAETDGRVFPETQRAASVIAVLADYLQETGVNTVFKRRIRTISRCDENFSLTDHTRHCLLAKKLIIATGGITYPATGSSGDGFRIARQLGHTITELHPGLVPLTVKERWIADLQGLSFSSAGLRFRQEKNARMPVGSLLFTHYGLSGPLALDCSAEIVRLLAKRTELPVGIDFCPEIARPELERRWQESIRQSGTLPLRRYIEGFLPKRMAECLLRRIAVAGDKPLHQLAKTERIAAVSHLKNFPLTITGSLPSNLAMITCGGIPVKEINSRTMQSKLLPGLYFCGEIIESAGESGGFNLQQAFSTGYLAGCLQENSAVRRQAE